MNKDPESWARVSAKDVASGSQAQAYNVLQMALADIAELAAECERLRRSMKNSAAIRARKSATAPTPPAAPSR